MENPIEVYESERDLTIARPPDVVLKEAMQAAKALGDVVSKKKKPVIMNGEQYLEFEDWQTVGRFYGVTAKVTSTSFIDYGNAQGFEARAVAIRQDGQEVSAAEAMCLNDEANWKSKPLFQLRSMAQTRACAKSLRNVLAWVVVLAGYKPTPAEEMTGQEQKPPIKEPQKKNGEKSPEDIPVATAMIKEITSTKGKKKDGSDWTLFVIHTDDDEKYSTFSKSMSEAALKFCVEKKTVDIVFEATEKGKNLKEIMEHVDAEPNPG
jgi:hypothetical protein